MVDLKRPPMSSDNRPYTAPNMFPMGYLTEFTGVGDDVTNGVIGGGALLALSSTIVEEKDLSFQFIRRFYLAGGAATWKGAVLGDWVRFGLHAPATVGTSNPGAGAYVKVEVAPSSGMHVYVPHPTAQGNWDLNLTEKLNSKVGFTKVVPVPASNQDGFFDWDMNTGDVALNVLQKGRYNLFDFDVPMHTFVQKVSIIGESSQLFTVPAVKPYLCLPHWHIKLTINNSTAKILDLGAMIYRGVP